MMHKIYIMQVMLRAIPGYWANIGYEDILVKAKAEIKRRKALGFLQGKCRIILKITHKTVKWKEK